MTPDCILTKVYAMKGTRKTDGDRRVAHVNAKPLGVFRAELKTLN